MRRIGLADLEALPGRLVAVQPRRARGPRARATRRSRATHQRIAIDKVIAGFGEHDRGKLIMACGTGKTFTILKLAEENVGAGGKVLFLVPEHQPALPDPARVGGRGRAADPPARGLLRRQVDRSGPANDEDISVTDLALPATTDVAVLTARLDGRRGRHRRR